jgi:hypothetical protein
MWLDAGFPLQQPGFVSRQLVRSVVGKAALGQDFSEYSETSLNGHPLSADTSLLWTIF